MSAKGGEGQSYPAVRGGACLPLRAPQCLQYDAWGEEDEGGVWYAPPQPRPVALAQPWTTATGQDSKSSTSPDDIAVPVISVTLTYSVSPLRLVLASVGPARLRSEVRYLQFRYRGLWAGQWQGAFPRHGPHSGEENTCIQSPYGEYVCAYSAFKGEITWFALLSIVCISVWIFLLRCCFRSCAAPTAACWTSLPSRWGSWAGWRCRGQEWIQALGRAWPLEAWRTAPPLHLPTDLRALDLKTTRSPCTTWFSCVCSSSLSAGHLYDSDLI